MAHGVLLAREVLALDAGRARRRERDRESDAREQNEDALQHLLHLPGTRHAEGRLCCRSPSARSDPAAVGHVNHTAPDKTQDRPDDRTDPEAVEATPVHRRARVVTDGAAHQAAQD